MSISSPASRAPDADGLVAAVSPPAAERDLRRAVLEHAVAERRRVFPPVVHVGMPGAEEACFAPDGHDLDQALRTDVVEALARRARRPGDPLLVWLTRRGDLGEQDADLRWARAARSAADELECELPMVVVTRRGWRDPLSGASRTWRRLRPTRR
ncbi:MAG: hypothetical protein OSB43_12005 [Nocardioides sp.]|uniref:hypothetical protein n=1 Tax=Nocardioides sp. TaxID=35761 RepID=UPI0023A21EF4|nr:hypothetical protein [Nocardioides sp.]MDE0776990.1 hypothetical protein [Nocardioides sp.]